MTIAITGATGFLGKYLVAELRDEPLALLGREEERLSAAFGHRSRGELIETDYSERSLERSLNDVDCVIHLAGIRSHKGQQSFENFYPNVRLAESLFRACQKLGIRNVVFASSVAVYSPVSNQPPFREDDPACPQSHYGLSKLTVENLGTLYGLRLKSLRLAQGLGMGERSGYMLSTFIQRAQRREPLIVYGEGVGRRQYVYARDTASAMIAALRKPDLAGAFNIGMAAAVSHRQLAELIGGTFGAGEVEIRHDLGKPENTETTHMDCSSASQLLGWQPQFDMAAALADMLESSRPVKP